MTQNTPTIYQRLEKLEGELQKLTNTVYALKVTDIQNYDKYFEELSNIPRGSYHEKAASDYCVAFAKAHGLEVWQDQAWNIMMVKEASEGYEAAEPINLQGHLDMVCEKKPGCSNEYEKAGLK